MITSSFMRLQNPDSTTDVICLNCFQSVTRSHQGVDLPVVEAEHICNPCDVLLQRYGSSTVARKNVSNGMTHG